MKANAVLVDFADTQPRNVGPEKKASVKVLSTERIYLKKQQNEDRTKH
jgi:hypothetical protein